MNCRRNSSGYFFMTDCFTVCADCFKTIVTNCSTSVEVCLLRLEVVIILCLNYNSYLILMKPSYEDNSIQFVSKPFRILDKKKTELAKIGKFMPSCTIKVCVLALRNRNPGNEWSFLSGRTSRGFHKHASKHTNYELKIGRVGPPNFEICLLFCDGLIWPLQQMYLESYNCLILCTTTRSAFEFLRKLVFVPYITIKMDSILTAKCATFNVDKHTF